MTTIINYTEVQEALKDGVKTAKQFERWLLAKKILKNIKKAKHDTNSINNSIPSNNIAGWLYSTKKVGKVIEEYIFIQDCIDGKLSIQDVKEAFLEVDEFWEEDACHIELLLKSNNVQDFIKKKDLLKRFDIFIYRKD